MAAECVGTEGVCCLGDDMEGTEQQPRGVTDPLCALGVLAVPFRSLEFRLTHCEQQPMDVTQTDVILDM